jgi:eukaryotic-like serine/threonine-protein kinase
MPSMSEPDPAAPTQSVPSQTAPDWFALFEKIVTIPVDQQPAALDALQLEPEVRDQLLRLLAADRNTDHTAREAVQQVAASISHPQAGVGMMFGNYRVLGELGKGGMGTVLLAERADQQYQTKVAIKLLRGFPTIEGIQRLKQERQILAALDHPNIARLIDGGETAQGQPYLVMEYVAGQTLDVYVRTCIMSQSERLALFEKLLDAVEHAHQRLVIHRDIKPSNIIVRADGEVKLLDFGIAKLTELDSVSARQTSTRVWTPGYASPEQQRGGLITVSSDVYSLGIVLRELLEQGVSRDSLDSDIRSVINKACEPDEYFRYASVEALREDLQRYQSGLPVRAAANTGWYRTRKFLSRHRWACLGAAALLALSVAFVWRLNAERQRAIAAELQARQQVELAQASNAFLVSLFQSANPINGQSAQITALELLDRGRSKVQQSLKDQPQLQAEMLEQLTLAYIGMSEHARAIETAKAAAAITPPHTLQYFRRQHGQISALSRSGKYQEALRLIDVQLTDMQQSNIDDASMMVSILNSKVMGLKWMDRGDEAIVELNKIMTLLPKLADEQKQEQAAYALDNMANTLESIGRFDEALAKISQAEQAFIALRGEGSIEPLMVARYRGVLELTLGLPSATGTLETTLAKMRLALAAGDRRLTNTQTSLAQSYLRDGRIDDAGAALKEAVERCKKAPEAKGLLEYTNCTGTLTRLGEWQIASGNSKAGVASIERALAINAADQDMAAISVNRTRVALVMALCADRQLPRAQTLWQSLQVPFFENKRVAPQEKERAQKRFANCK